MTITVTRLPGLRDYQTTFEAMKLFSENRTSETADEIWILEHPPVFTLGLSGKQEHILNPDSIPVIQTDRGGQITYHGPGQLVLYTLLDINRFKLGVRQLVTILEQAIIDTLAQYGIQSDARPEAPGVYVENKKIASIGLRVKKGCCYHGISINNRMDLSPFDRINTCGYPELEVTKLADHDVSIHNHELAAPLIHFIITALREK